jgi:hypothetical protein
MLKSQTFVIVIKLFKRNLICIDVRHKDNHHYEGLLKRE